MGVHRAQRFLNGAWLIPLENGYSRAVPLRFLLILPEEAVPAELLRQRQGWKRVEVTVRGRGRTVRYRVEGPFLREGLPDRPMFLIVIEGGARWAGKRRRRRV